MLKQFILLIFAILFISSCTMGGRKLSYLKNPNLKVIKANWQGNTMVGDLFTNDGTIQRYSFWQVLKWKFQTNPQQKEKDLDTFKVNVIKTNNFVASKKDMIVWLGHSSFFIRIKVYMCISECLNCTSYLSSYEHSIQYITIERR